MGITGLLPFLAKATEDTNISRFRGGTVAVDSYCWLHKGANACAEQLVRGDDTDIYVNYCLKYVNMLVKNNIHVIMVFDGHNLPAKSETEAKRRQQRRTAKQRTAELLRLGKVEEARNIMKQAIDITPKMAHKLIQKCREIKNVDCIVAPYESDAQLAFFSINNIADCIITEDSDLILFGCKKVMYKMDMIGNGQLVHSEKINEAMKLRPDLYTFDKFRYMCILSGCDYLNSLSGIGLKKALKFLALTAETDPLKFLDKVPRYLNMRHLDVTEEYKEQFMIAYATFKHQTVFDPFKRQLVSLTDPAECGTDPKFCKNAGAKYDNDKALKIALGNLHPSKDEEFGNWYPPESLLPSRSIWAKVPLSKVEAKPKDLVQFGTPKTYKQSAPAFVKKKENTSPVLELDDELSIYKQKSLIIVPKKEDSDDEKTLEEDTPEKRKSLSPVIGKNPFLKKKLSKFNTTPTPPGNVITKSRYFNKVDNDENKPFSESQSSIESTKDEPREPDSQSSLTSKVLNLDIEETPSKKRSIHNISDITNTESETPTIDLTDSKDIVKSQNPDTKRIKLGPCRTVGLKKKPPPPGQKTLQQFFTSMQPKKN